MAPLNGGEPHTFHLTSRSTILYNLPRGLPLRYTASDTDAKLTTLLETAQREPVFIERDQKEVAVILSARDYNRLSGKSIREFNAICDQIADEAAANGLTEEILAKILSEA